jgi:hypothetical protein
VADSTEESTTAQLLTLVQNCQAKRLSALHSRECSKFRIVTLGHNHFLLEAKVNSTLETFRLGHGLFLVLRGRSYLVFGDFWFSNEISFWAAGGTATAPLKMMLSASTFFP